MAHFGYRKVPREEYRPMFHFPMRDVIKAVANPPEEEVEKIWKAGRARLDTKNHKPHPEPLLLAATRLGLAPAECVYIGDVDTDAQAASASGMKFIMYKTGDDFKKIPQLIEHS